MAIVVFCCNPVSCRALSLFRALCGAWCWWGSLFGDGDAGAPKGLTLGWMPSLSHDLPAQPSGRVLAGPI